VLARWGSWPRWKWLLVAGAAVYVLGLDPLVDYNQATTGTVCDPGYTLAADGVCRGGSSGLSFHAPKGSTSVARARLFLGLATLEVRLFELDFVRNRYQGFGVCGRTYPTC
jgi:hypothetical protein